MAERALQIPPDARQMPQVLRLAIAHVEPCENAKNLARALGGERRIDLDELRSVEIGRTTAAAAHISAEQRKLSLFRHVDTRILQQRSDVIGRRAHDRVLEVEKAEPRQLAALRQPEQVWRIEVTQNPGLPRPGPRLQ